MPNTLYRAHRKSGTRRAAPNLVPITQSELRELQALRTEVAKEKSLRDHILRKQQAGATVEDGPLDLCVEHRSSQRLNFPKVAEVIGKSLAEELLADVSPTEYDCLLVVARTQANSKQAKTVDREKSWLAWNLT